jgi:hypothetical protein
MKQAARKSRIRRKEISVELIIVGILLAGELALAVLLYSQLFGGAHP